MAEQMIDFKEGMKLGVGFNRLTSEVLDNPVVTGKSKSGVDNAGGQSVTAKVLTIQDSSSLHKQFSISADASASYFGIGGSVKVQFAESFDQSDLSVHACVSVSVRNSFQSLDAPEFSEDAKELLLTGNTDRFRQRFGDCYIAGIRTGGEYIAVYEFVSSDRTVTNRLAADVHAAYNGFVTRAELNVNIRKEKANTESHLQVNLFVFREGTIRKVDLNVEDIFAAAEQFPLDVSGANAYPYAALVQKYEILKSPNDAFNFYDISNQADVLNDLGKKRLEYLALRDTLAYMLKNAEAFENADGTPADRDKLSAASRSVVEALNTMHEEASACSKDPGKCQFSSFDAATVELPKLSQGMTDVLAARGEVLAKQDPRCAELRAQQAEGPFRRGLDIGLGIAEGHTLPGPGKDLFRESLKATEQAGYDIGVHFSIDRNRYAPLAAAGAKIAEKDPVVAEARTANPSALYWLGFDIAVGHFAEKSAGGEGSTLEGPGSNAMRDSLSAPAQAGFKSAVDLYVNKKHRSS